jgi:hypothetical protein
MDNQLADRMLERVANGEPLRRVLRENGINPGSWFYALEQDASLVERYARAKAMALEAMADAIVDISDDITEDPARSRLKVDTRKWLLSKLAAKKYGEKITTENTGADGGPIKIETSDTDWEAKARQLLQILTLARVPLGGNQ